MSFESIKQKLIGKNIEDFVKPTEWRSVDGKLQYEDKYGIPWVTESSTLIRVTFGSTKCGISNVLSLTLDNGTIIDVESAYDISASLGTTRAPSLQVQENDMGIMEEFLDRYLKK